MVSGTLPLEMNNPRQRSGTTLSMEVWTTPTEEWSPLAIGGSTSRPSDSCGYDANGRDYDGTSDLSIRTTVHRQRTRCGDGPRLLRGAVLLRGAGEVYQPGRPI